MAQPQRTTTTFIPINGNSTKAPPASQLPRCTFIRVSRIQSTSRLSGLLQPCSIQYRAQAVGQTRAKHYSIAPLRETSNIVPILFQNSIRATRQFVRRTASTCFHQFFVLEKHRERSMETLCPHRVMFCSCLLTLSHPPRDPPPKRTWNFQGHQISRGVGQTSCNNNSNVQHKQYYSNTRRDAKQRVEP